MNEINSTKLVDIRKITKNFRTRSRDSTATLSSRNSLSKNFQISNYVIYFTFVESAK